MNEEGRIEKIEANIGSLMGHISILRLINFRLVDHVKADCEPEFSLLLATLQKAQKHHAENAIRYNTPYYNELADAFSDTLDHIQGTRLPSLD